MGKKEIFRRYIVFILGLFFAGIGVTFTKHGDLGVSPISSVANVMISDTVHKEFGNVKVAFDVVCVIVAVGLSVIFFQGKIVGTREGTVISALLTGLVVKFIKKHVRGFVMKTIEKQ